MSACALGHTRLAYECPACSEAKDGKPASEEHWRWYRSRTSSKRIKERIDSRAAAREETTP